MSKIQSSLLSLTFLVSIILIPSPTQTDLERQSPLAGFVYAEADQLMLDGAPFLMKGFNYYPRDYGWTSMADWDWEAVDREFALAASLHANTIRTGISWQYTTGNINNRWNIYTHHSITPESFEAIDHLLELADKHGLKIVLWIADGFYFELSDPHHYSVMEAHLQELIPKYANDPRLAAWDLMTDIDGAMLQPIPDGCFGALPSCTKGNMLIFLQNMAATIRELDSNHLITVGFSWPSSSILTQGFTDFISPQFLGGDHPELLEGDRIGEMEDYGRWSDLLADRVVAVERIEQKVRWLQSQLDHPMPIVLSEFGWFTAAPDSSLELQEAVYEGVLEVALLRTGLAGVLNWALTDFIWPPKAYTNIPLNAPMSTPAEKSFGIYDLDYLPKPAAEVAKAYYAAAPTISLQTHPPSELQLLFDQSFIPEDDPRELSVVFDWIEFNSSTGDLLQRLDLGTPEARPSLKEGFFWMKDLGVTKRKILCGPEVQTNPQS